MSASPPPPARVAIRLPHHRPWLTPVILVLNVLLFLALSLASGRELGQAVVNGAGTQALVGFGAKANWLIAQGEYWRLVTPIFLHIGLIHLLFNQYALYSFGREVEGLFGTARFAAIYLLSGIAGCLLSFAFSVAVSAGASGAIFGIIGAQAAFLLRNREALGRGGQQQLRSLGLMIALNLYLGFSVPGIDNLGHLGGLLAGVLLGALLSPTYGLRPLPEPPYGQLVERPLPLPAALTVGGTLLLLTLGLFLALPIAPQPGP